MGGGRYSAELPLPHTGSLGVTARVLPKHGLLATPAELASDPVYLARMAEVMANPDAYPAPPREGPSRDELLKLLAEGEAA